MTLTIALNYGSRDEIKQAVQQIATDVLDHQLKVEEISEDLIDRYLMTYDLPPLDLMIRTSGELRISNYLLWQLLSYILRQLPGLILKSNSYMRHFLIIKVVNDALVD